MNLLETEDGLNCYMACYGEAHIAKAFQAVKSLPSSSFAQPFELFDWGCGQGIGTVCLIQYLRETNQISNLKQVTLIEPSSAALARAELNIHTCCPDINIAKVNKGLPPTRSLPFDCVESIDVKYPTALHLFSNILDIETIDLKVLAKVIVANGHKHIVSCIGPANRREDRINTFCRYFDEKATTFFQPFRETEFFRCKTYRPHTFGCFIRNFAYSLDSGTPVLIPYKFFAPKQFRAAYKSDLLDAIPDLSITAEETAFDVLAPFDLGASIYDDINPVLAVINNMVVRGLPTKASPYLEELFVTQLQISKPDEKAGQFGTIAYIPTADKVDDKTQTLIKQVPLAVARIQKTIIEAILTGHISIESDTWNVLVKESDVPCAAIAFSELAMMFNHIASASRDFDNLKFPNVELTIINSKYQDSPLHLGKDVYASSNAGLREKGYDMVIDFSIDEKSKPLDVEFSEFKAKNQCYFNVRSVESLDSENYIYTTDRIVYKPLTLLNAQGLHENIEENVAHLRYFVQMLFRKQDFREGQLPIISRALQLKSVIGLLPTGGGKSLTYQVSAMLQPGIAIVVDPLVSLMKDQYDGLKKCGIDICTYINSTVTDKAAREREMKESKKLFVLMSPERLAIYRFRESLRAMKDNHVYFSYGVIDEVHCVSEWGHDFRFAYLHLGRNMYQYVLPKQTENPELNHITMIGLTATASFDVLADVERELSGDSAFPLDPQSTVRYENTNRLELQYRVIPVDDPEAHSKWDIYAAKSKAVADVVRNIFYSSMEELLKPKNIATIKQRFLDRENIDPQSDYGRRITDFDLSTGIDRNWFSREDNPSSAIVFCPHRIGSIGVNDSSNNPGIARQVEDGLGVAKVSRYCGGDVLTAQDEFIQGDTNIMVATKAFGMGIDKPNVRFTLNINHSGSLEAYVQEAGRAGRDRKMALSVILYNDRVFNEQDPNTRLFEPVPVDYGVHKFFYDGNFIGPNFEKWVMYYLMTQQVASLNEVDEISRTNKSVSGFLSRMNNAEIGESIVAYISYKYPSKDSQTLDGLLMKAGLRPIGDNHNKLEDKKQRYYEALMKAIYRMCCIGLIEDYTQDYIREEFRLVTRKLAPGSYFKNLQTFLERYFSEERAATEIEKAKLYKGATEMQQCLGYLTDFIYGSIATKRKRAIQDIDSFCKRAINSTESWLKVNEDLKDDIYFYFNSKYARPEFEAPNGESFSLVKDTDEGKRFDFDHIYKYMRVIDDDLIAPGGTPKDNVKHLLGAVRLVRRSLTDKNPTLDFLNVFCLFYLKADVEGTPSGEELERSYKHAYSDLKGLVNSEEFYSRLSQFKKSLADKNIIGDKEKKRLEKLELLVELNYHVNWTAAFSEKFSTPF
ncbi:MAG: DEAD/DEAH box helicase [Muribaculum sp.]|nr:DEAD/DEAH box helicase [Muribaculum sp.]